MKKFVFLFALLMGTAIVTKAASLIPSSTHSADVILYAKVINDTGVAFDYKVGTEVYTIEIGESEGFAFEEGTQILKKDESGNWINWFVFGVEHSGQSIQLSTLL